MEGPSGRTGFRKVGTFREVGFKFGKYWDVTWYENDLAKPSQVSR